MTRKEIDKVWEKKRKVHERLEYYQSLANGMFNTRNYQPHIDRAVKRIHMLNEILYREENIDRKMYAL